MHMSIPRMFRGLLGGEQGGFRLVRRQNGISVELRHEKLRFAITKKTD